jgi:hypothetical protein
MGRRRRNMDILEVDLKGIWRSYVISFDCIFFWLAYLGIAVSV